MKIINQLLVGRQGAYLVLVICSLVVLAYLVPMVFYSKVAGTDVYTHMLYTNEMASVDSLQEFYDVIPEERAELGYNYPFGLWLFGSIVSKMTGMAVYDVAYLLPFLLIIITLLMYYHYSGIFLEDENQRILSLIFLLSIPIVSIFLLRYRSSVIVIPLLLLALYCGFSDRLPLKKRLFLISLSVPPLCLTHTGTYMFLMSFIFVFIFLYAILWGVFHRESFLLFASSLVVYILVMGLTPNIQGQYITKATLVLTVGSFMSSKLYLPFVKSLSELFYKEIFVNTSPIYLLLWLGFTYAVLILLIHVRRWVSRFRISTDASVPATIPLVGSIQNISHSVISTPLWANPIHTIFSLIGFLKINRVGKCAFLSVLAVTILPGSLVTSYTGALREIYYLLVIIPVTATIGFSQISGYLNNRFKGRSGGIILGLFYISTMSGIILAPIIGNTYYLPTISGKPSEIEGLMWLGDYGSPMEKAIGVGYRDEIGVYAKKERVYTSHGTETRRASKLVNDIYFSQNGEASLKNLYSEFNPKYIVSSSGNINKQNKKEYIDENTFLDRVYNSGKGFSVYSILTPTYYSIGNSNRTTEQINFNESPVDITDSGATYLIQADNYRIRIGKENPRIRFLGGSNEDNIIGAGYFSDSISLKTKFNEIEFNKEFDLSDLYYRYVELNNNQLSYKTFIEHEEREISTIIIRYTFYQKAIKKEVIVANDWLDRSNLLAYLHTRIFSPLTYFRYEYKNQGGVDRRIYPSEDNVRIGDTRFNNMFVSDGDYGIDIEYDKTSPCPAHIIYKGSTIHEYGFLDFYFTKNINPASSVHVTQHISLGERETARDNIGYYKSVSLYPYPNGELPVLITSRIPSFGRNSEILVRDIMDSYEMLNQSNITEYTEAISVDHGDMNYSIIKNLSVYSPYLIGYLGVGINDSISNRLNNFNITGVIPLGFRYNLSTIDELYEKGFVFAEVIPVGPPFYMYNQEGLRHLQRAYCHGVQIPFVLFPVSTPDSSYLREGLDTGDRINQWMGTVDSAVEYDDLVNFQWDTYRIGSPLYLSDIRNLTQYIKSEGMTFTTPEGLVRHYLLMQNISLTASRDIDSAIIRIENRNIVPVDGATVRVVLPKIDFKCPYIVEDAVIARAKTDYTSCIYYLSTGLEGNESKIVVVRPGIVKKRFSLFTESNLVEGLVCVKVRDDENNSVSNALITISGRRYRADGGGGFCIDLVRGRYGLRLEKPGYETAAFDVTVKSRFHIIERIDPGMLLLIILGLSLLFLFVKFLSKNRWFRVELKRVEEIEKEIEGLEDRIELKDKGS